MRFNISATLGDLGSIRVVRGDVHDATLSSARQECETLCAYTISKEIISGLHDLPVKPPSPPPPLLYFAGWEITE